MNNDKRLEEAFQYIKKTFFPKWDKKNQWIIKIDPQLPTIGLCDSDKKTISLRYILESKLDFLSFIIHEICHSSRPYHGKKWTNRMIKAKEKAFKIGEKSLANKIQSDLDGIKDGIVYYAKDVYGKFEDVLMDIPDASYETSLNCIADYFGMYPEDLEKRYKKCKQAYEKAQKHWKIVRDNRAKFEKLKEIR